MAPQNFRGESETTTLSARIETDTAPFGKVLGEIESNFRKPRWPRISEESERLFRTRLRAHFVLSLPEKMSTVLRRDSLWDCHPKDGCRSVRPLFLSSRFWRRTQSARNPAMT